MLTRAIGLCCLLLAASTALLRASPITVPADLGSGDSYRLAFVTSGGRDALSANIDDYNDFVTTAANSSPALAALGTTWKTIASTPSINAKANTLTDPADSIGVPIYNLFGERVAHSYADLWNFGILALAAISGNEEGSSIAGLVWTGTQWNGESALGLELGSAAELSSIGHSGPNDTLYWIDFAGSSFPLNASDEFSLYGISSVLTVPEPSTGALAVAGVLLALFLAAWRRRPSLPFESAALCLVTSVAWCAPVRGSEFPFEKIQAGWIYDFSYRGGSVATSAYSGLIGPIDFYQGGTWSTVSEWGLGPASADGHSVAYLTVGFEEVPTNLGIVRIRGGAREVVALDDAYTLSTPHLANGRIAFALGGELVSDVSGSLDVVLGAATSVPDGLGGFYFIPFIDNNYSDKQFDFDGQLFAVHNANEYQEGIYTNAGGAWRRVADTTTQIPNGVGTFTRFNPVPAIDGDQVLFVGFGAGGAQGIFRDHSGSLDRLVDLSTPVPGGGEFLSFDWFHGPALSDGRYAFVATFRQDDDDYFGIFGDLGRGLERVVADFDLVNNEQISLFALDGYRSRVRLEGNTLAFNHFGGDGGLYIVTVPEPSTLVFAGVGAALAIAVTLLRRARRPLREAYLMRNGTLRSSVGVTCLAAAFGTQTWCAKPAVAGPVLLASTQTKLVSVDPVTGSVTPIGPMERMHSMTFDRESGTVYGVTSANTLVRINPANGATTPVAAFGGTTMLAIEYVADRHALYGVGAPLEQLLYTIDPLTAQLTPQVRARASSGVSALGYLDDQQRMLASPLIFPFPLFDLDLVDGTISLLPPTSPFIQLRDLAFDVEEGLFAVPYNGAGVARLTPQANGSYALTGHAALGESTFGLTYYEPVPEPSTLLLGGIGMAIVLLFAGHLW